MQSDECKHHWVLDEKSFGVCKLCGATKQHPTLSDLHLERYNRPPFPVVAEEVASVPEKHEPEAEVTTANQSPAPSTVTCPVCGKSGIGARGLASHLYYKHKMVKGRRLDEKPPEVHVATEEKPFECPYCPQSFHSGKALGPHIRFKHPEKTFERRFGIKIVPIADKEAALLATAEHIGRLIDAQDVQKAKLIDLLALTLQAVTGAPPDSALAFKVKERELDRAQDARSAETEEIGNG